MLLETAFICLALNTYHEAKNQSLVGQIATAQVVMNRVEDNRFPNTICEVVKQGPTRPSWEDPKKEYPIKHRCQFSWYCDGKDDTPKNEKEGLFGVHKKGVEVKQVQIRREVSV